MEYLKETIAAICTGLTGSGINIIRISGDEAFTIADKVFKSVNEKKVNEFGSFSVHYGYIVDNIDNVDKTLDDL